jgi:hypothetical protein
MGVLYAEERPTYERAIAAQHERAKERFGPGKLEKLLHSGETWKV